MASRANLPSQLALVFAEVTDGKVGLRQYFALVLPTWENSSRVLRGLKMFESDQHEFDEEYAEISHPAPPLARSSSAVATIEAPAAVATTPASTVPPAAKTTIATQRPIAEEIEESEAPAPQEAEQEEFVDPAEKVCGGAFLKKKRKLPFTWRIRGTHHLCDFCGHDGQQAEG